MTNDIKTCICFMIESIGDESVDWDALDIDHGTIIEFGFDSEVWDQAREFVEKAFKTAIRD